RWEPPDTPRWEPPPIPEPTASRPSMPPMDRSNSMEDDELLEEPEPTPVRRRATPAVMGRSLSIPEAPTAMTTALFVGHLIVSGWAVSDLPFTKILQSLSMVAGGWMLFLGEMTFISIAFQLALTTREAWKLMGWSAIPIVLRAVVMASTGSGTKP